MSQWITKRPPTDDDAYYITSAEGIVWITKGHDVEVALYKDVAAGTPWMPITSPEPYVNQNMSKHTPGPLSYIFGGDTTAYILEADGSTVAKLSVTLNSTAQSALIANTRLFSAAPELLEACESLLRFAERDRLPTDVAVNAARAAIAKAKGEQP